jgi:hypothetical protein
MQTDLVVVRLDAARVALREAKTLQDKHKLVHVSEALNLFAKRQGASEEVKAEAHAFHVDTMLLLGEALKTMEKNKGAAGGGKKTASRGSIVEPRDTTPTLSDLGIDKKTSMIAQQIATLSDEKQRALRESTDSVSAALKVVTSTKPHVSNNSGENEWYTPSDFIDAARNVMGGIDCDPASSEIANRTVKAATFYTHEQDGRKQLWGGRVWMNPPYAQPLCADFCLAVCEKYKSREIDQACVLVNNATETAWFQSMLSKASAVCFPKGRVKFIDVDGNASGAPLQGQAVIYFGSFVSEFSSVFGDIGPVFSPCLT